MSQTSPSCGHTLNLDDLNFSAEQINSLRELVVTAVLEAPALKSYATLVTGIKNDRYIGTIPGTFGLIGKAAQGCNPVPQCYELPASQKKWAPKQLEVIIDMCFTEFENSVAKYALACGVDKPDLTKTEIMAFILNILASDIPKMVFRYAWFGDVNATNEPVGTLTPGIDPTFFNVLDGFFVQMAAIYALNPLQVVAIPGNSQATYALQQSVLTPALAYGTVNTIIDSAPSELAMQPDRILLVTRSVFDRLRRQLQALGTAFQDYKLMVNGLEFATWDGVPILSLPLWDEMIRAYFNDTIAGRWNDPHRVVYTTISNLNIGMECTDLFGKVDASYDKRSRMNRIEARDAFDMKIIDDRLLVVGR